MSYRLIKIDFVNHSLTGIFKDGLILKSDLDLDLLLTIRRVYLTWSSGRLTLGLEDCQFPRLYTSLFLTSSSYAYRPICFSSDEAAYFLVESVTGFNRFTRVTSNNINVVRASTLSNLYLTTPELLLTCKKTETISRLGLPFVIQISPDVNEVSLLLKGTPNSSLMTKWLSYAIVIHHDRK